MRKNEEAKGGTNPEVKMLVASDTALDKTKAFDHSQVHEDLGG